VARFNHSLEVDCLRLSADGMRDLTTLLPHRLMFGKEIRHRDCECARQKFQRAECHVTLASLDRTNVSAVQPTDVRESLLRQSMVSSVGSHVVGKDSSKF
jgi:hypothetical protein